MTSARRCSAMESSAVGLVGSMVYSLYFWGRIASCGPIFNRPSGDAANVAEGRLKIGLQDTILPHELAEVMASPDSDCAATPGTSCAGAYSDRPTANSSALRPSALLRGSPYRGYFQ